jgi:hypothetical protein
VVLSIPFDAYWLGLLDRDALGLIDEAFYRRWTEKLQGRQVSFGDDAWNLSGFHDWEAAAIEAYFPPAGRVAVTGAGAGREVLALRSRGFDAVGFEPNLQLVESGRRLLSERGYERVLDSVSRDCFPAAVGGCAAVVVGWGSYQCIPARARRIRFLGDAREALDTGAPVLLSFFTRSKSERAPLLTARLANIVRHVRRSERVEPGDTLNPNFLHRFTREEIEDELSAGGFSLIHFAQEPYGHAVGLAA